MESTFAITGFAIWPDLPKMQSLNHTIKTHPTVSLFINEYPLLFLLTATKLQDPSLDVHWSIYFHPQGRGETAEIPEQCCDD